MNKTWHNKHLQPNTNNIIVVVRAGDAKRNNLIWYDSKIMQYRRPACEMRADRSQAKAATFGNGASGNIRLGMRLIFKRISNIFTCKLKPY